ncbi:FHA domain-containing protein [Oculatella sp. LEGE 06141]|uniref:FHA domain-containing protein n=1 Tax=Oculatella sp. LEGE 06141 TaxID=1828648 RepID=UPI001A0E3973|nr:FHA domain-containing protein [Oculatella sp. LEGE 06141]
MSTIVQPVLDASKRCKVSPFYIQGVTTGRTSFLVTKLVLNQRPEIATVDSSWSIGRSLTCSIVVQDRSVSRCHAVIGHHHLDGFYIADVGSSNGTWVNQRKLTLMERRVICDNDLIQLGSIKAEFFVTCRPRAIDSEGDTVGIQITL